MHIYRVTYLPAANRNEEVLGLLKERVKMGQARGVSPVLSTQALSPDGGPRHQLGTGQEDISKWGDAWSAYATKGPDAASAEYFRKIEPMLRGPIQTEMWEILVPVVTPPKVGEFIVRQSVFPVQAHAIEFRSSLTDLTKAVQAKGLNVGLYAQFLPHAGPVLQTLIPVSRLGDWDAFLAKRTPEIFNWLRTYMSLVRKPFEFDLWTVITEPPKM